MSRDRIKEIQLGTASASADSLGRSSGGERSSVLTSCAMNTEKRKSREILQGLYRKHYLEFVLPKSRMDAVSARLSKAGVMLQSSNEFLDNYRSGPETCELHPTYQMNEKRFLEFVRQLEAAIRNLRARDKSSQGKASKFFDNNRDVFHALIDMGSPDRMTYFNLLFLPRSARQQRIVMWFVTAYLGAVSPRLNIQGPKSGAQAISKSALVLAERMRRSGKGTRTGSVEAITNMVLRETGHLPDSSHAMQYSEAFERRREATRKNVLRHFKRKGI